MTALQQIMSRLGLGETGKDAPDAAERRNRPDRRSAEPHDNVFLLHGTESRLQFAARAIGFGTYDLDCESREIRCSPELQAIAGLPEGEASLPLERVGELIHPDDRERVMAAFAASLDPRTRTAQIDDHCRLLRPDGGIRQVRVKGRTLFFGHGSTRQLLGASGVVIDLTAGRAGDELLRLQAGLIDLAPEPLLVWEESGAIVAWNAACEAAYGYRRDEALGQPLEELLKPRFPTSRADCLAELARQGRWSGEVCYTCRDGRRLAVECRLERIDLADGPRVLEADRHLDEARAPRR